MTKLLERAIEALRQLPEEMQDSAARAVMLQLEEEPEPGDLEAIAEYLDERSAPSALNTLAAINSSINALAAFPKIGRIIDEFEHRSLPVLRFPYIVFYRIADNELLILHIRLAARSTQSPVFDLSRGVDP